MITSLPINQLTFALSSNTSPIIRYILSTAPTSTGVYVKLIISSIIETIPMSFTLKKPALVDKIDKNFKYKLIETFNNKRN